MSFRVKGLLCDHSGCGMLLCDVNVRGHGMAPPVLKPGLGQSDNPLGHQAMALPYHVKPNASISHSLAGKCRSA